MTRRGNSPPAQAGASADYRETRIASLASGWAGTAARTETTLHQLSPYIGKTKSSMAAAIVSHFTKKGEVVYDPFSGSGTIALEAWRLQRRVITNDLSPYASLLTRAKLFPYRSAADAMRDIDRVAARVPALEDQAEDLRDVPQWVRDFFHPRTLRETLAWVFALKDRRHWFLLACLLGILHHQRPGFLSYPSSHTIPYQRLRKFPSSQFPELYEYRSVRDRLEAKVARAFRRVPELDFSIPRRCFSKDAGNFVPSEIVDAIITSPPYMRQLDYARDNRLRLWFLGMEDWHSLDKRISPGEDLFLRLMRRAFLCWHSVLKPGRFCILVIGDTCSRVNRENLPDLVSRIATTEIGGYSVTCQHTNPIPDERRVRRGIAGSTSETILVLQRRRSRKV